MLQRNIAAFACALFALLLLAGPSFAANVGVANMQIIAQECAPAIAAKKLLDTRLGGEKSKLEKEAQALQKRTADFQKKASTMSQAARQKEQEGLMKAGRAFDEKTRKFSAKIQQEENKMRQSLAGIVLRASESLSKKKNLDIIIDSGLGTVLFAKGSLDVTDALLQEVNAQWKAQGSRFK